MRSSISIVLGSLLALAAAENSNPFNIPNGGYTFKAGEPTTVKWNPTSDGTVSLKLQSGELLTPDGGTTIALNIDNSGSYEWTPPKDIVKQSDYTIEIVDDEDPGETNYMPRFSVSGATATASSSATDSSSASASSSTVSATTTDSSSTDSASTMTTMTSTTNSSSSSTTGASSTSASDSSSATTSGATATGNSASGSASGSASSSADASSTSPSGAAQTGSDTSAGMVNRVSGGMMAVVLGAMALM